ncbi:MAG: septum site-determining protein MinC [Legionella sp.]|nr:septum site-determining protein MinC [Legionella sp.]
MSENATRSQSFKLKGRLYTLTVLQILDTDKELFSNQCAQTVEQAPNLFRQTPVVFDLSFVGQHEVDLHTLCQIANMHGMIPIAIQGGNSFLETIAYQQGLAVLNASSTQDRVIIESVTEPHVAAVKTKLISTPVRSGQQVVAKAADLIITSTVSHGAELLADGSIHVYGALRGRALAGMSGDKQARIFCQSLEAELVSIAGFYKLSDAIEPMQGPCQIYLLDEHIHIEPL